MEEKRIIKSYKNKNLTVLWEPKKCIHSGICVKMLPNVYDPDAKPWIKVEEAGVGELMKQIDKCPSGALSYQLDGETNDVTEGISIDIMNNGPLLVKGKLKVTYPSGQIEEKDKTTAFCRCGASKNKPYCDGAHNKVGFEG